MSLIKKNQSTGIGKAVVALKAATQNATGLVTQSLSRNFAQENFATNQTIHADLEVAEQGLVQILQQTLKGSTLGLEELKSVNIDAAVAAALGAGAPVEYSRTTVRGEAELRGLATENMIFMPSSGEQGLANRSLSLEAFDNTANKNAMVYSMVYNAFASRQDEFGETFFPTIIQTHDQVGYIVTATLVEVINDIKREITGAIANWNRKNVIRAYKDATILDNTSTKLVPVHRTETAALFNADIGTVAVKVGQESVTTGALLPGKTFDLLGVSQTAGQIAAGVNDSTDAIDSAVKVTSVYIELADDDIIEFNVSAVPTFGFNQTIQGNVRLLQLSANTKSLLLNGNTKQTDGTDLTGKATISTNSVRLGLSLFGTINQQEGTTQLTGGEVTVEKVLAANGDELALGSTPGSTIKALFAGATIVGYKLEAHRTNSNRRQRGQLIDSRELNYLYAVPVLPPISSLRPVGQSDAQDQAIITSLINTTRARTSNSAVLAVINARNQLKAFAAAVNNGNDDVEIFGAAQKLVTPTYVEETIAVQTSLDSLTSSQRAEDVEALLINKIRDVAFRLYRDSNYKAAADAQNGGESVKPFLIIGTDTVIGRYLTLSGDTRLAGEYFDYKVVTTVDDRMKGKIVITFGRPDALTSGQPDILHFGNMAWKPELTLALPNTRNGAQIMELTVQPMYLHVPNLPILGWFDVTGIESVIASKVAINNKPV